MERAEIWKPCPEANNLLEVSSLGRVRVIERDSKVHGRKRNGKVQGGFIQRRPAQLLSPCVTKGGYLEIAVRVDGARRKFTVHRLVGKAFVEGYFEGASIDHLDGNKLNNLPDNLEWVTLSENTKRQWTTGLVDLRGELHPSAKLTNLQAHAIECLHREGFPTSAVAEWFGVSTAMVYKIAHGNRQSHASNSSMIGRTSTRRALPQSGV